MRAKVIQKEGETQESARAQVHVTLRRNCDVPFRVELHPRLVRALGILSKAAGRRWVCGG